MTIATLKYRVIIDMLGRDGQPIDEYPLENFEVSIPYVPAHDPEGVAFEQEAGAIRTAVMDYAAKREPR